MISLALNNWALVKNFSRHFKINIYLIFPHKTGFNISCKVSLLETSCLKCQNQGPVVQSVVCLTSPLVVKILTVLGNTISNSQVFLLKKCECICHI